MPANNLRHGGVRTRLYECWKHMRRRCNSKTNSDYPAYGGRGIVICKEWDDFAVFRDWSEANGYKHWLTLDRKDNNLGYFPENCQWSDEVTQANNRNNSLIVKAFGESKTVSMWTRDTRCKVAAGTLYYRINSGWSGESALSKHSRIMHVV